MKTALLTFLGGRRNKPRDNNTIYESTAYQFPDGSLETTDYFAAALRHKHHFSQIVILGTATSIWDKLADDAGDLELALEIIPQTDEVQGLGLMIESLKKLEILLTASWGTEVILFAGEGGITSENAQQEMMRYVEILQKIQADEILLDFTHGFRPMPMLLNSALQFWQSLQTIHTPIRMVYGEFSQHGDSTVHYLDDIQHSMKVAQAVRLFFEKMDGSELAGLVEGFWPSGCRYLKELTERLQENKLNQIGSPLRQFSNSLQKMSHLEQAPPWFKPIRIRLIQWLEIIQNETLPLTLANLAEQFSKNRLHTQAIIALHEAMVEQFLLARNQSSRNLSDRERKDIIEEAKWELGEEFRNSFDDLQKLRNFVAHGAREVRSQKNYHYSLSEYFKKHFNALYPVMLQPKRYFSIEPKPQHND